MAEFSVNVSNGVFLLGHSVSSTEMRIWTQYAIAPWNYRSGVDLDLLYGGDVSISDCNDDMDTVSVVDVEDCHPEDIPDCDTIAATTDARDSGGYRAESDICVWGAAKDWELRIADFDTAPEEGDYPGILTHEFGHFLNLGHPGYPAGTMAASTLRGGNNRFLYGDDVTAIRSAYTGEAPLQSLTGYWREWDAASGTFSAKRTMSGSASFQTLHADIGANSSGVDYVVAASVAADGSAVIFRRAAFPLGTTASWTQKTFSAYDTWVAPALTSNHTGTTSGQFVAAWPEVTPTAWDAYESPSDCGFMRVVRTTNAFDSFYTTTWSGMCTVLSPTLEYVSGSGRNYYVLLYVNSDFDPATAHKTGEIMYSTSTDGLYWVNPTGTGLYTFDTPSVACDNAGECQMSYLRGSSDLSSLVTRRVLMTTSKTMTIPTGEYDLLDLYLQRAPDIVWDGDGDEWLSTYTYTSLHDWRTKGYGAFYAKSDSSNPMDDSGYAAVGEDSEHPATLAGNHAFYESYLFYVD